jgi:hypothetical protein
MWTKKHAAYSLQQKLPPAAQYLWQWLEETKTLDKPVEPDLRDFNKWVARHRGKGYCRQTVKDAFSKLSECGIVRALKNFGHWAIHRVIVRAIESLMPPKPKPKKNLRSENSICDSDPSNPQSVKHVCSSSSNSLSEANKAEVLQVCADHGIHYSPDKPAKVFEHPVEDVKQAIKLFYTRGGHQKITNPCGWLIECLEWGWWHDELQFVGLQWLLS